MDSWPYVFRIPLAYQNDDPVELTERIIDYLQSHGFSTVGEARPAMAIGRLSQDGTRPLYVNVTPDPTSVLTSFNSTGLAPTSQLTQNQRALATRLQAFLDLATPTQAQNSAAIRDLIRALRFVWQSP